jgi:hypothetical protein
MCFTAGDPGRRLFVVMHDVMPDDVVMHHVMDHMPFVVNHMMVMMDRMIFMDHYLVGESGRRQGQAQGE